jgi:GNAT superfamily N-acetyltransferase
VTIEIRPLTDAELTAADARLPLHRLDQPGGFYLVAWDAGAPVGHAHLAPSPLEVQDMYVIPELRGRGIGTALLHAAEDEARSRGATRLTLTVGVDNARARRLYERHGYGECEIPPKRVEGTILLRGEPYEVDDTLITLARDL